MGKGRAEDEPRVGEVVHFRDGAERDLAAIVVRVWESTPSKQVDLRVFGFRHHDKILLVQGVEMDMAAQKPNTWHRVDASHA
jgi:hypothetical protein